MKALLASIAALGLVASPALAAPEISPSTKTVTTKSATPGHDDGFDQGQYDHRQDDRHPKAQAQMQQRWRNHEGQEGGPAKPRTQQAKK